MQQIIWKGWSVAKRTDHHKFFFGKWYRFLSLSQLRQRKRRLPQPPRHHQSVLAAVQLLRYITHRRGEAEEKKLQSPTVRLEINVLSSISYNLCKSKVNMTLLVARCLSSGWKPRWQDRTFFPHFLPTIFSSSFFSWLQNGNDICLLPTSSKLSTVKKCWPQVDKWLTRLRNKIFDHRYITRHPSFIFLHQIHFLHIGPRLHKSILGRFHFPTLIFWTWGLLMPSEIQDIFWAPHIYRGGLCWFCVFPRIFQGPVGRLRISCYLTHSPP